MMVVGGLDEVHRFDGWLYMLSQLPVCIVILQSETTCRDAGEHCKLLLRPERIDQFTNPPMILLSQKVPGVR